jgi:hypothetical protein
MKNISRLTGIVLMFLLGFVMVAKSAGVTDLVDYCTGPNQKTCPFKVDVNGNITSTGSPGTSTVSSFGGNLSVTGTDTFSGITVYPPQIVTGVSSITVISPAATYLQVLSTAGVSGTTVICGAATPMLPSNAAIPCIATATATNGQYLIITCTSTLSTVTFSSGTAAGMDLGAATRVVQWGRTLSLIYDAVIGEWKEISYGNN